MWPDKGNDDKVDPFSSSTAPSGNGFGIDDNWAALVKIPTSSSNNKMNGDASVDVKSDRNENTKTENIPSSNSNNSFNTNTDSNNWIAFDDGI